MGLRYPTIFLDCQIFNLIFIVLNGYFSFKLIIKLIPPEFSTEERRLYNKYFSRYFKPHEFRKLADVARRRVYRVSSNLINQGNGFSSLFFVVDIPDDDNISINLKIGGSVVKKLLNFAWIGIVEYTELISNSSLEKAILKSEMGNWGLNVEVNFGVPEESSQSDEENFDKMDDESESDVKLPNFEDMSELSAISKISKEIIIYEFDLEVILH
jgi:hypothetical protein